MADIAGMIREAFLRRGLDPDVGMKIASIESRMNPNAKNPRSSAGGLFQFIDSTAAQYGLANKFDPRASAEAAADLTGDNAKLLRGKLGRDPSAGELYLAHQQGGGGALKLLSNPDAPAAALVGEKAVALNGGRPGISARDFASLWDAKINGAKVLPAEAGGSPAGPAAPGGSPIPSMVTQPGATEALPLAPESSQTGNEPSLAGILTAALGAFAQKPAGNAPAGAAPLPMPAAPPKRPNLANILAGTSSPLLIGRPVA